MDIHETTRPVAEEIERYRREMMAMYQQQAVTAQATPPEPQPQPKPDIPTFPYTDDDLNGEPPFPVEPPADPPPIGESRFVGYLRVYAFTGSGAEPLEGAQMTVFRGEENNDVLYANAVTDRDGFTPVLPLPTVDPAFSMRPDGPSPFVSYDIAVSADGFRPTLHRGVPIYGNNYVTQPVALIPLLPGQDSNDTEIFQSGGPADL